MKSDKDQKVYSIEGYRRDKQVVVEFDIYQVNHSLAVSLFCQPSEEEEADNIVSFSELFSVITVNLQESGSLPFGTQFVDINNHPGIHIWLMENDIADPIPVCVRSGFCVYQAFKFHLSEKDVKVLLSKVQEEKPH